MLSQLSQRERIALAVGALVVLLTLVFYGLIAPYRNGMDQLDTRIAARQRQIREVQTLRNDYLQLQKKLSEAERRLDSSGAFSLFSFVESASARIASKENLVYMRPQPASVKEGFREESVEIKLEKIRLNQLVQLLYEIETAKAYLQVKSLRVKTRFDDRSMLDTVLTIAAYGRSS